MAKEENKPKVVINDAESTKLTPEQELAAVQAELKATKEQLRNLTSTGVTLEMEDTVRACLAAGHTREDAILIARREQLGKEARKIKDPVEREAAIRAAAGAM